MFWLKHQVSNALQLIALHGMLYSQLSLCFAVIVIQMKYNKSWILSTCTFMDNSSWCLESFS